MTKKNDDIIKSVLGVYKRVNPSYIAIDKEEDIFSKFINTRKNILSRLSLPPLLYKGKKLIELGGGTGENALLYSMYGADVTIVDPNEISCERSEELFNTYGFEVNIINKSLFDVDKELFSEYEIVNCEGVLQHTFDPVGGLNYMAQNIKEGTILFIALAESNGWFKRMLQRNLVRSLGGNDEEKIVYISKKYFQEHLDRAVKYGLREEKNIIFDTFINPQIKPTSLKEICDTLRKNDISHFSSYPRIGFFEETIPWGYPYVDPYDYTYYENYYKILEKFWLTSGDNLEDDDLSSYQLLESINKVESEYLKLVNLKEKIDSNSFKEDDLRPIQYGYLGIGQHFFVGVKN